MEWERLTDQGAKWQNTDKWEPIFRSCLSLGHLTARFLWNIAIRSEFSEMDKNKKNLVDVYCLWVGEPPIAMSFKWTKNKVDIDTCEQVSRGMEFLEQHKIVHGDLAARWLIEQPKCKNLSDRFSGTSCSLKKAQLQKCPTSASLTHCTPPLRSWTTPRLVFLFGGWRPRFWWIGRWVTWHVRSMHLAGYLHSFFPRWTTKVTSGPLVFFSGKCSVSALFPILRQLKLTSSSFK